MQYLLELYHKYYDQYFILLPFFVVLGIITFVATSITIPLAISIIAICITLSIYLFATYESKIVLNLIIMFVFGIFIASLHNNLSNTTTCFNIKNAIIIAKIEQISYGKRPFIFGMVTKINDQKAKCEVKINYLDKSNINIYQINAGDVIGFTGSVKNSKPQVFPRSDKDYIEKIKGKKLLANVGGEVVIIKKAKLNFFEEMRTKIAKKIDSLGNNGAKAGYGIMAALTIGNTGYIPEETLDNIRKSGFAHLLAISGLHLGTIVGFIFIIIRWGLSFISYICLNFNTKKIAAVASIVISFCYLQIANGSISVHRSFIMCGLLLIGILLDRKGIMLRIWGFALFYVVIFMPHKIFMPSMQMSFIATLTLIAVYQKFSKKENFLMLTNKNGVLFYISSILLSSFVTGFTTMFYEAYHFGQWSIVGIISNELAIPIAEFLLLPISMIAILFTDTLVGNYLYQIANFLGEILASLANFFATQKFSCILLKPMPSSSILIITIGIYIIFITLNRWAVIGAVIILIGLFLHFISPKPIFILDNRTGQAFYLGYDNKYYINKPIQSDFIKKVFSQQLAQKEFITEQNSKNWLCNDKYCTYHNIICVPKIDKNNCDNLKFMLDLSKKQFSKKYNKNTIIYKKGITIVY